MTAVVRLGLAGLVLALTTSARAHSNQYVPTVIAHGGICRNYNAAQAADIDYAISGVRNLNAAMRPVICPLERPRFTADVASARHVYVYGYHASNVTTTCTAYFLNASGAALGSATLSRSGAGSWVMPMTFTDAQSFPGAMVTVLCNLPGAAASLVQQIVLYPY